MTSTFNNSRYKGKYICSQYKTYLSQLIEIRQKIYNLYCNRKIVFKNIPTMSPWANLAARKISYFKVTSASLKQNQRNFRLKRFRP